MNTTNTNNQREDVKPLYKTLNEQRTQGEWILKGSTTDRFLRAGEKGGVVIEMTSHKTVTWLSDTSAEANAQYTALCVNNLHLLAEALEAVIRVADRKTDEFDKAKEALKRIS